MMPPIGKMLVKRPIACARRSANWSLTMPTADGISPPPPIAWSARKTISQPIDGAIPQSSEPIVNMAMQNRKTRLRPRCRSVCRRPAASRPGPADRRSGSSPPRRAARAGGRQLRQGQRRQSSNRWTPSGHRAPRGRRRCSFRWRPAASSALPPARAGRASGHHRATQSAREAALPPPDELRADLPHLAHAPRQCLLDLRSGPLRQPQPDDPPILGITFALHQPQVDELVNDLGRPGIGDADQRGRVRPSSALRRWSAAAAPAPAASAACWTERCCARQQSRAQSLASHRQSRQLSHQRVQQQADWSLVPCWHCSFPR